jgi:hypothetical protein
MACPIRGFYNPDILLAMDLSNITPTEGDRDRARLLIQRLGEGDFLHNELSNFIKAFRGKNISVFSFYETLKTPTVTYTSGNVRRNGEAVMVAPRNSVILDWANEREVPTEKDHSNIVKFSTSTDETYTQIMWRVRKVLNKLGNSQV